MSGSRERNIDDGDRRVQVLTGRVFVICFGKDALMRREGGILAMANRVPLEKREDSAGRYVFGSRLAREAGGEV